MDAGDTMVVNAADPLLNEWVRRWNNKVTVVFFGDDVTGYDCVWCSGDTVYARYNGTKEPVVDITRLQIKGKHNIENVCAAAALTLSAGIDKKAVADGACSFNSLAHRLEFIREIKGVSFYNDSKATTAESVICAVNAFKDNVHLIAGGKDKGCDYSLVNDSIKQNVRSVTLIGEAAVKISKEWQKLSEVTIAGSLEEALAVANSKARKGDVVVLSPACSSFDMFAGFEERGDIFKQLVNEL
jgi:UDP-N-acetylmuramoylalanine--D-glutamate ligase